MECPEILAYILHTSLVQAWQRQLIEGNPLPWNAFKAVSRLKVSLWGVIFPETSTVPKSHLIAESLGAGRSHGRHEDKTEIYSPLCEMSESDSSQIQGSCFLFIIQGTNIWITQELLGVVSNELRCNCTTCKRFPGQGNKSYERHVTS